MKVQNSLEARLNITHNNASCMIIRNNLPISLVASVIVGKISYFCGALLNFNLKTPFMTMQVDVLPKYDGNC